MKTLRSIAVLLLSACSATPVPETSVPAAPAAATPATSTPAPVRSGIDLAGYDRTVRPADDLYKFAAGGWIDKTQIPADRSNYGAFLMLTERAEQAMREIVEAMVARTDLAPGSDERKLADFYRSFMDTARVESLGFAPLRKDLERIDAIRTRRDLIAYLGAIQPLSLSTPLQYLVEVDALDPSHYVGTFVQSGLTLPDRDYYLKKEAEYDRYRDALLSYARDLLAAAGGKDAARAAARVLAFETQLAQVQWSQVQSRDPIATYNRKTPVELARLAPQIDWALLLRSAGVPVADVVVSQPSYVTGLGKLVAGAALADWRTYLRFKLLDSYAPLLHAQAEKLSFEFHDHALEGVEQPRPRQMRALDLIDLNIGEISGRLYVERHFSAEAKARMRQLVGNLLAAFRSSLERLDWMSPQTRAEALQKLGTFNVKVGYPDRWRDYGALAVAADDLLGNVQRAVRFDFERRLARISQPVDRDEWGATASTVNAFNRAQLNDITFPAAILQPPFFDPRADDAVNYGGIGGIAGHEISHSFDDQGRQFDHAGRLRDWWTADDAAQFRARAQRLEQQYSAYTVLDGEHLNGELTLGENIADLAGVAVAYQGYMLSLQGRPAPVLDGFTGAQRVFLGWAQIWRRKYRDDNLRMRLSTDPHSPAPYRVNGVATNLDAFHEAFGTAPQDRLYKAPADRVRIW